MAEPWERQADENGEPEPMFWFDRFDRFYRTQGPERSLVAAFNLWRASKGKGSTASPASSWRTACDRWQWRKRAEAWDLEQMRLRRLAEEQDRAEMLRRHVQLARGLQTAGGRRLKGLVDDPAELSAGEARQYVKEGIGLERQALGLPEHLIAVAAMTDDELFARYRELLAGIASVGSGDDSAGVDSAATAEEESQPEG